MKISTAAVAALATVASATPAMVSASDIQALLDSLMTQARSQLSISGWQSLRQPRASALNGGDSQTFTLQLNAGRQYVFVGVCDADCSDMDLTLRDSAGNILSQDVAMDDTPVVRYSARSAVPNARLTVTMASCSVDPCFYQVGSFGQPR
jgi:hypothetical protein